MTWIDRSFSLDLFIYYFLSSPEDMFFIDFRERGRGERERETRDNDVRETLTGPLLYVPQLGIELTT